MMPFDAVESSKRTNEAASRVYVCESGAIRVKTKHTRQSFSPEEFIGVLRKMIMKEKERVLPTLQSKASATRICGLVLSLAVLLISAGCAMQTATKNEAQTERVISVGGAITETIYALGAGEKLVGTDTSSIYPEAATKLPQVGYQRTLSAEGVLSLKPSLVMILPEAGPPAAIQQIENAGIKILRVGNESTVEGTKTKIRQIAEALNRKEKGEEIIKQMENDLAEAEKMVAATQTKPKVVFIYSRGGTAQVGGRGTPAEAVIKMAGGENIVTGFADYKPLTAEALVAAEPDVILLPTRGLASLGGVEAVLSLPGVRETPAGKNQKIVTLDDMLLLGFTPRLGQGVKELCAKIH